jgi:predicted NBD/HSP70 family sugar kinase
MRPDHYNPVTMLRIGIDLGGSKIEAVALAADGTERVRRRRATPVGDYAATVGAIAGLVCAIEDELGESGSVGIGTPGAVSAASGRMKNCNSTWLNGQPLADDLARALARPVRLANDAGLLCLVRGPGWRRPRCRDRVRRDPRDRGRWRHRRRWPSAARRRCDRR